MEGVVVVVEAVVVQKANTRAPSLSLKKVLFLANVNSTAKVELDGNYNLINVVYALNSFIIVVRKLLKVELVKEIGEMSKRKHSSPKKPLPPSSMVRLQPMLLRTKQRLMKLLLSQLRLSLWSLPLMSTCRSETLHAPTPRHSDLSMSAPLKLISLVLS